MAWQGDKGAGQEGQGMWAGKVGLGRWGKCAELCRARDGQGRAGPGFSRVEQDRAGCMSSARGYIKYEQDN